MKNKDEIRGWQLAIQHLVSWTFMTKFFSRFIHYIDLLSLRLSKGKFSPTGYLTGWPIIKLTTIGAKSGLPRSLPLVGIQDGEKVVLIASNFGCPSHPSWYYNLLANPDAWLESGEKEGEYRASLATGTVRDHYWQMAVNTNFGYSRYQERTGDREIPIIVLTPKNHQSKETF